MISSMSSIISGLLACSIGNDMRSYIVDAMNIITDRATLSDNDIVNNYVYNSPMGEFNFTPYGSRVTKIGAYGLYYKSFGPIEVSLSELTEIGDYAFPYRSTYGGRTIRNLYCPKVNYIGEQAMPLSRLVSFSTISFPQAEIIGDFAFYNTRFVCDHILFSNYIAVDCPNAKHIGRHAFELFEVIDASCPHNMYLSRPDLYLSWCYSYGINIKNVETIGESAFAMAGIKSVTANKLRAIESGAFYYCPYLSYALFETASFIGSDAFKYCIALEHIDACKVTHIYEYAFNSCHSLSTLNLPNVTEIKDSAFTNCSSIEAIFLPRFTGIGSSTAISIFAGCTQLQSFTAPVLSYIGLTWFSGDTRLKYVNIPNVERVGLFAFANCQSLEEIALPNCEYIASYAFKGCSKLCSIYFMGSKVVDINANLRDYTFSAGYYIITAGIPTHFFTTSYFSQSNVTVNDFKVPYDAEGYVYVPASMKSMYESMYFNMLRTVRDTKNNTYSYLYVRLNVSAIDLDNPYDEEEE